MKTLELPAEINVMEDGKPFFFEGGSTGCLLIHGFTGTTSSMRQMGEYLAERGMTVLGPRLPGHGTNVEDMARFNYHDWIAAVETALAEIQGLCDRVFVSGLSMGGALTLYLGEQHSNTLAGLMPINAPCRWLATGPMALGLKAVPMIKHIVPRMKGPGNDLADPDVTEVAYPRMSTRALHELVRLLKLVDKNLGRISAPIKVFVSANDHVVPVKNAVRIYEEASSEIKEVRLLERSFHVATMDIEKELLFGECYAFIQKHSG